MNEKFVKYFTINVIYIPTNGFKLDKIILNLITNPLLIKEGNYSIKINCKIYMNFFIVKLIHKFW